MYMACKHGKAVDVLHCFGDQVRGVIFYFYNFRIFRFDLRTKLPNNVYKTKKWDGVGGMCHLLKPNLKHKGT